MSEEQRHREVQSGLEIVQVLLSRWKLGILFFLGFTTMGVFKAEQSTYLWTGQFTATPIGAEQSMRMMPQQTKVNAVLSQYEQAFRTLNSAYGSPPKDSITLTGNDWPFTEPNNVLDLAVKAWTTPLTLQAALKEAEVASEFFGNVQVTTYLEVPTGRNRKPIAFYQNEIEERYSVDIRFSTTSPAVTIASLERLMDAIDAQVEKMLGSLFASKVAALESIRETLLIQLKIGVETLRMASATGGNNSLLEQYALLKAVQVEIERSNVVNTLVVQSDVGSDVPTIDRYANYLTGQITWTQNGSKFNTIISFAVLGLAFFVLAVLLLTAFQSLRSKNR